MVLIPEYRYQVHFGLLNALHFGAPQHRIRFFLLAAKHGITLPELPKPTHFHKSCQRDMKQELQLDDVNSVWSFSSQGAKKGEVEWDSFSVEDALADLPQFDW